jgi:hypothetical protein
MTSSATAAKISDPTADPAEAPIITVMRGAAMRRLLECPLGEAP